jgi:hypothetical protein
VSAAVSGVPAEAERLRDALAAFAHDGRDDRTFGEENCRSVLAAAGVSTTPDEFERARVAFRQMPFHGGNYTLDARRLLKAIGGDAS